MKLSLIVPAHNEEGNIDVVVRQLIDTLTVAHWSFEIILVNDNSTDSTAEKMQRLNGLYSNVHVIHRNGDPGLGNALRAGFAIAHGQIIIPFMGDLSDDPSDISKFVQKVEEGYDVVLGSRFVNGGSAQDYPPLKLILNRCFNWLVRILFGLPYKDLTNAFKAYRRKVIQAIDTESNGFEITVELPVKSFLVGCKMAEVPVQWRGRTSGVSKMKFRHAGLRYLQTVLRIYFGSKIRSRNFGPG